MRRKRLKKPETETRGETQAKVQKGLVSFPLAWNCVLHKKCNLHCLMHVRCSKKRGAGLEKDASWQQQWWWWRVGSKVRQTHQIPAPLSSSSVTLNQFLHLSKPTLMPPAVKGQGDSNFPLVECAEVMQCSSQPSAPQRSAGMANTRHYHLWAKSGQLREHMLDTSMEMIWEQKEKRREASQGDEK